MWKKPLNFWCWIGIGLAYGMAVQTNPFLFTFPGFSIMLILTLSIAAEERHECDPAVHL
jgi:prepilin signal peptidase PulO-like enzyme (type II secretory pathway)